MLKVPSSSIQAATSQSRVKIVGEGAAALYFANFGEQKRKSSNDDTIKYSIQRYGC